MDFLKMGGNGREEKKPTNAITLFVQVVSMSTSCHATCLVHGVMFSIGLFLHFGIYIEKAKHVSHIKLKSYILQQVMPPESQQYRKVIIQFPRKMYEFSLLFIHLLQIFVSDFNFFGILNSCFEDHIANLHERIVRQPKVHQ